MSKIKNYYFEELTAEWNDISRAEYEEWSDAEEAAFDRFVEQLIEEKHYA
jgi:hypothetical protein